MKKLDGQDTLAKTEHLQAIMTAGRAIHGAVIALDAIVADRLGVHRNDLRCLHLLKSGPATAGEVAARTGLTSGSVTALLDRLEAGGHIERQRSTSDRRSVEIAMTECRLRELEALSTEIEAVIRDHFGHQPAGEIAEAGKALGSFAEALGQCAERLEVGMGCGDKG
nr:MarR family transcriptional regulator [Polymorphobacter sp.]